MVNLASSLDSIFGSPVAQIAYFLAVLGSIASAFYMSPSFARDRGARDPKSPWYFRLSCAVAALGCIGALVIFTCIRMGANADIEAKVESGVIGMTLDGEIVENPATFVRALASACSTLERRSHPTSRHAVTISTRAGPLELQIGKDSEISDEFWIFYPRFRLTRENEVRRACGTGLQVVD